MKLTYNKKYVGDVLFVTLKGAKSPEYTHYDEITVIKNEDEIIGINIFNASKYFDLNNDVNMKPNEGHVSKINELLKSVGEAEISPDLSPKFVVGYVKEKEKHPDADKLNVCQVNLGDETTQIVCGAKNVDQGQHVVVAKVGAIMPNGLYIQPSQLRGVDSNGMICSKSELNLDDDGVKGIYVLDDSYEAGQIFEVN